MKELKKVLITRKPHKTQKDQVKSIMNKKIFVLGRRKSKCLNKGVLIYFIGVVINIPIILIDVILKGPLVDVWII